MMSTTTIFSVCLENGVTTASGADVSQKTLMVTKSTFVINDGEGTGMNVVCLKYSLDGDDDDDGHRIRK